MKKAILALADGESYEGWSFGAEGEAPGEAVPLFGVGQVHRLEGRCGLRHRLALGFGRRGGGRLEPPDEGLKPGGHLPEGEDGP